MYERTCVCKDDLILIRQKNTEEVRLIWTAVLNWISFRNLHGMCSNVTETMRLPTLLTHKASRLSGGLWYSC
jgi:hypothetical protein